MQLDLKFVCMTFDQNYFPSIHEIIVRRFKKYFLWNIHIYSLLIFRKTIPIFYIHCVIFYLSPLCYHKISYFRKEIIWLQCLNHSLFRPVTFAASWRCICTACKPFKSAKWSISSELYWCLCNLRWLDLFGRKTSYNHICLTYTNRSRM